jgi:hypothetical protein
MGSKQFCRVFMPAYRANANLVHFIVAHMDIPCRTYDFDNLIDKVENNLIAFFIRSTITMGIEILSFFLFLYFTNRQVSRRRLKTYILLSLYLGYIRMSNCNILYMGQGLYFSGYLSGNRGVQTPLLV